MTSAHVRDTIPGGRAGRGLLIGLMLVALVEAALHTDSFLLRFRSVFAAGRAADKLQFSMRHCPQLLVLGNSRADNAFDPKTIVRELDPKLGVREAFNLGVPGADTRVLSGLLDELDRVGCFSPSRTRFAVISLDEALVQKVDTLGQEVFFASRQLMWSDRQFHDWVRSWFRLYGYSDNIRQLREPAVLSRFLKACVSSVDPVGGAASEHLGYRAGFGALQDASAAMRQEAGSREPPSSANVRHLWRMIDLLTARGVRLAVIHPPLLNRDVLYRTSERSEAAPYLAIARDLGLRGLAPLPFDSGQPRRADEFVNVGHLNDKGAQRYSAQLGRTLSVAWSQTPVAAKTPERTGSQPE